MPTFGLESCGQLGPAVALTWSNGQFVVSAVSVAFTVIPRCSPLDLVRLRCAHS